MQSGNLAGKAALFSFLLVILISGTAAAQPQLPCAFYGSASINGRPVPSGSVITAQIDGVSRGSVVVSADGKYGGPMLDDGKLHVYDGSYGDQVIFYVQTPSMDNRLEAAQKGTWLSGEVIQLDLIFTGEEIPRAEQPAAQGGGAGTGGSGSGDQTEGSQQAAPEQYQDQGRVYDITANLSAGNVTMALEKGDEVTFTYNGKAVSVKVKSMSDFAVLFTIQGADTVIAEKGSVQSDSDSDGFQELWIEVGKVKDEKAETTFSLYQKPAVVSGQGATGMLISDGSGLWISVYVVVIIAVLGGGVYVWRKRGVRNEGYQGFK